MEPLFFSIYISLKTCSLSDVSSLPDSCALAQKAKHGTGSGKFQFELLQPFDDPSCHSQRKGTTGGWIPEWFDLTRQTHVQGPMACFSEAEGTRLLGSWENVRAKEEERDWTTDLPCPNKIRALLQKKNRPFLPHQISRTSPFRELEWRSWLQWCSTTVTLFLPGFEPLRRWNYDAIYSGPSKAYSHVKSIASYSTLKVTTSGS